MTDHRDEQREAAAREAKARLRERVDATAGDMLDTTVGDLPPWGKELLRRYENARREGLRLCPHLHDIPVQPSLWIVFLPELLTCKACEPALTTEVIRQGKREARCFLCDRPGPVRGVTLTVESVLLRGGICERCEEAGGLTP